MLFLLLNKCIAYKLQIKKSILGLGKDSVPKVLIHKHADLCQDPQHPSKNPGAIAPINNPRAGRQRPEDVWVYWPTILAKSLLAPDPSERHPFRKIN